MDFHYNSKIILQCCMGSAIKILPVMLLAVVAVTASGASDAWKRPALAVPNDVQLGGVWGAAYQRGLARLGEDPFTDKLLLADVNFNMKRWFTNFSGDLSGRFIEVNSLSSSRNNPQPAFLREVLDQITMYHKADGHFGADVDWSKSIDLDPHSDQTTMMPILWGNGRLLLGLTAAYNRFGDKRILAASRKLGDFYVKTVVGRMCDPARMAEYRKPAQYASDYITCVFEGMGGLVQLYRITKNESYLKTAMRMADFHEQFDVLPIGHSHGNLSQHEALVSIYEETGDTKYLNRAVKRWEQIVDEGYVNPTGGILEKFTITGYNRDEGCSEADWLRLNLMLWHNTGNTRYLDMAERELWCEYLANQWPSGGYGHRFIETDDIGPYAYKGYSQEAVWCCCCHGPLGLYELKGCLAVFGGKDILYNFPVDFTAPVKAGKTTWKVTSVALPSEAGIPVCTEVTVDGGPQGRLVPFAVRIPEWASAVVVTQDGKTLKGVKESGYMRFQLHPGMKAVISYQGSPYLESRRLKRIDMPRDLPAALKNVVVRNGPYVMLGTKGDAISDITLMVNSDGTLLLPKSEDFGLSSWRDLTNTSDPHPFVFNVRLQKAE